MYCAHGLTAALLLLLLLLLLLHSKPVARWPVPTITVRRARYFRNASLQPPFYLVRSPLLLLLLCCVPRSFGFAAVIRRKKARSECLLVGRGHDLRRKGGSGGGRGKEGGCECGFWLGVGEKGRAACGVCSVGKTNLSGFFSKSCRLSVFFLFSSGARCCAWGVFLFFRSGGN